MTLGLCSARLGRSQEAIDWLQNAAATFRRIDDTDGLVTALNDLGLVYKNLREWREATRFLEQALSIDERAGLYARMRATNQNLGLIRYRLGQWDLAEENFRQSLQDLARDRSSPGRSGGAAGARTAVPPPPSARARRGALPPRARARDPDRHAARDDPRARVPRRAGARPWRRRRGARCSSQRSSRRVRSRPRATWWPSSRPASVSRGWPRARSMRRSPCCCGAWRSPSASAIGSSSRSPSAGSRVSTPSAATPRARRPSCVPPPSASRS